MEEKQKSYYAIIPANVRYDNTLNPCARLLYGEITALSNAKGMCWATNQYFSELYGVSERTITSWIKLLKEKQYIDFYVETKRYDDGTIKKVRVITISPNHIENSRQNHIEISQHDHIENSRQNHIEKNFAYNNTYNILYNNINNTNMNNKENKKDINIFLKEKKKMYENEFVEVWKLYPKKVGMQKSKEYYVNARLDGVEQDTIVNGINAYVDFIKRENKERKYIKDGSTWFHQKCWNDEYEENISQLPNVDVPDGYVLKGGKLWQK